MGRPPLESAALLLAVASCTTHPPGVEGAATPPAAPTAAANPASPARRASGPAGSEAGSAALGDGSYRVLFDRRSRVGEQRQVTATAREVSESTFSEGGRRAQHEVEVAAVRFAARCLTRSVSPQGEVVGQSCKVDELTDEVHDRALAPRGSTLVVERAAQRDDAVVTLDGSPADEALRAAVDLAVGLHAAGESDDRVYGSDVPRRVGDTWQVHGPELARRLTQQLKASVVAPPTGRVELVAIETVSDLPVMHLRARLDAVELTTDRGRARFTTTLERKLPLALGERAVWQSATGEFELEEPVAGRPGVTLDFKLLRTNELTSLPVE